MGSLRLLHCSVILLIALWMGVPNWGYAAVKKEATTTSVKASEKKKNKKTAGRVVKAPTSKKGATLVRPPMQQKTAATKPLSALPDAAGSLTQKTTVGPSQKPIQRVTPETLQKIMDQKLVVVDAGHGGYDLGAKMAACDEKSLALSMALLTKKHLTDMGYRVILTRSRDIFMPLEKRVAIANETKGKLFVSIHCNAAKNPIAKGIEIFYHASQDKKRAGFSKKLAERVLNTVIYRTGADNRGVKEGKFYVIRETQMPAVLIETGFMTHPDELHLLKDIQYRDKLARGIAEGIDAYFKV